MLPITPVHFMRTHGVGNFLLGILLLLGAWQPLLVWIALVWWLTILPFAFYVNWRNGFRDLAIICSITSLLLLVSD